MSLTAESQDFCSMRSLPTTFKGLKFRSRAEARWAVVFEELGWSYYYEPEGFCLASGKYLPDFYLPSVDTYFEVKGTKPNCEEIRLADQLCAYTGSTVIISHGPPNHRRNEWDLDLSIFNPEMSVDDEMYADWQDGGFVSGRRSEHPRCSIDLGNCAYLGAEKNIEWRTAFLKAANHRFGIFE